MPYLLPDLQRPLAQGFGFLVFAPLAVQHGQVVEGGGHGGVILPESLLADCQRVVQQVSRLLVLILIPTQSKACDEARFETAPQDTAYARTSPDL